MPKGDNPNSRANLKPPFGRGRERTPEQTEKMKKTKREKAQAKKTFRELYAILLDENITDKNGKTMTTKEALAIAQIKEALTGKNKSKAFEVIRDTIGEKPVDKIAVAEVDAETITEVEQLVKKLAKGDN